MTWLELSQVLGVLVKSSLLCGMQPLVVESNVGCAEHCKATCKLQDLL